MTSIVIIDDVKGNRLILGKIIETIDPNISVQNFDRAELALAWINNQTPDLVITDYKLPGLDGIEFIERLRSGYKSREIPVLMITMAGDLLLPTRARGVGATAFLRRPVDHDLVRARIRSLLSRRHSRGRLQLIIDNPQPCSPA
jgi:Response regulator containing CheY-like receiver, AAA-type ATPase, and DNA-binding domains